MTVKNKKRQGMGKGTEVAGGNREMERWKRRKGTSWENTAG